MTDDVHTDELSVPDAAGLLARAREAREAMAQWLDLPELGFRVKVVPCTVEQVLRVAAKHREAQMLPGHIQIGMRSKPELAAWLVEGMLEPRLTLEQAYELLNNGPADVLLIVAKIIELSGYSPTGLGYEVFEEPHLPGIEGLAEILRDATSRSEGAEDAANPRSGGTSSSRGGSPSPQPVSGSSGATQPNASEGA